MSADHSSDDRDPVERLAEEFVARHRRGEYPLPVEYAERYPQWADRIHALFPALLLMEHHKPGVSDPSDSPEESGGAAAPLEQLGDYRIIREVGRGGMAIVYEAEQESLGRHVALKVLLGQSRLDPKQTARFQREARAAARLHHTNIVPVYGVGEHDGVHYYVMQFIPGQALDEVVREVRRLRRQGPTASPQVPDRPQSHRDGTVAASATDVARALLTERFAAIESGPGDSGQVSSSARHPSGAAAAPEGAALRADRRAPDVPEAPADGQGSSIVAPGQGETSSLSGPLRHYWRGVARIGVQVAEALQYAHAQGVLHRDIKPSNLLLDLLGTVWVADFGLAKLADQADLTHTGDVVGTWRYLAPERFRGVSDPRSDVYSLGLTLYELLVLRPAFDGSTREELLRQVSFGVPPRPRKVNPEVPRDLETIVLKAIERSPAERYQSAEELAEDLGRFLEDRPPRARRSSPAERAWRWARRNPVIAGLGGVLIALLVAVAVGSMLAASYFRSLAGSESRANQQSQADRKVAVVAERQAVLERDKAQRNEKAERWERYRSNITVASAALQLQNSGTARSALEEAPKEHHNWEWRCLHSQLEGASLVQPVPGGKINSLVLSPLGRQIAVCCYDHNEVYLYDVATGKLEAVLRGHSAPATSVAYRPDGKQVATSGNDQTIRLWDPAMGQQMALLRAEAAPPNLDRYPLVAFNSDGSRIASSTGLKSGILDLYIVAGAGTSRLWDAATGKEIAVLAKWQEGIRPVAFSPDGKRVAVGSTKYVHLRDAVTGRPLAVLGPHAITVGLLAYSPDGRRMASALAYDPDDAKRMASATDVESNAIHLWDGESGKEVAVLGGHTAPVSSVLFSPDGSRLVSGSIYPDNTARLWDAATGRLLAVLDGHKNKILTVAFRPDGERVVTAAADRTARLWDGRTGQWLTVLQGNADWVRHVVFSPNGARVVTASEDGTLRLWDTQTGELIGVLRGHGDGFMCPPVFTPDGSRLVSGSTDGTVRIWDMSLVERNGILRGHESFVYDVALSPNGEQVASAAWDGTARLWDATTGRQTGLLKHATGIITSVAYSRDGRRLATVERQRGVTLWDVASQKAARDSPFIPAHIEEGGRASLNPAGTLLAAGCAEGPVRLWDVATGREVARLEGHDKDSLDVAFHPDGSLLATAGADGTVRLWDVATRAPVAVLRGHTSYVWRVAFSDDGKLLASGSSDKTICLWDARTHKQLAVIPVGSMVYSVAFSPDDTRLAAGCRDNTVRLFDVASRQQVAELRGHTDYVHAVAWSPDGTRLVSGSGDTTVRVWDALSPAVRAQRPDANHPPR